MNNKKSVIIRDPINYFTAWFLMQMKVDGKTFLEYLWEKSNE